MHTELSVAAKADASTADKRWAAWVARGAEQDTTTRKQSIAAAVVVVVGLGVWLAMALSA